jgi:hypothetical protein
VADDRIPFLEAIHEDLLFKKQFFGDGTKQFPGLSKPQQAALKIYYGLPLDEEELKFWALSQGHATFDYLGYPETILDYPYVPKEYSSAVLVFGRRSGKTSQVISFVEAYEATCGGHLEYVAKRQECALFLTAQKAEYASDFILQFVLPLIEDSPLLAKRIERSNSDGILLSSGIKGVNKKIAVRPAPPNIKAFRGPAIPVIGMDEAAFWYKDAEAANPDYEVERAVDKALAQFPYAKKIVGSTPWTKEGIVFDAVNAGTEGVKFQTEEKKAKFVGTLVLHAPTPALKNPLLAKEWFQKEFAKDPDAYKREIKAEFVDAVDGIFSEAMLRKAMEGQPSTYEGDEVADREPLPRPQHPEDIEPVYVAAMDPAFKRDAFAFGIFHHDPELGVVQDVKRRWKAEDSKHPLKPADIFDELKPLLERYKIVNVLSDQYQLEALQQLAQDRGFSIEGVTFTAASKAKLYGSVLILARQSKLKLLDDEETFQELLLVQKHQLPQGGLHISAPPGRHDDMATIVVLGASRASQFRTAAKNAGDDGYKSPSLNERVQAHLARKRELNTDDYDND